MKTFQVGTINQLNKIPCHQKIWRTQKIWDRL